MLKIRLMRIGAKQKPFYRIVVVDERNKRDGAYLDLLGTYNPLTEPKDIKLDKVKLEAWLKKGAQKSDGLLRMLKEAPQRPPRKPKKEKKQESEEPKAAEGSKVEEKPAEEAVTKEEPKAAEEKPSTPVIPSVSEESPDSKSTDSSQPEAVQNDKEKEEPKDEGSA